MGLLEIYIRLTTILHAIMRSQVKASGNGVV